MLTAWNLLSDLERTLYHTVHCVPKTLKFLFFEELCQRLTDFNNFGVLNPEKIWHEYFALFTLPVRCSHLTLGNPKNYFQQYHSYILQIIYVISEENELQLLYCSLAVYLLLFSASYYLHSPITASDARYRRSACIEYQSAIRTNCGSGLLRPGLNFDRAWCTARLIRDEKDWKHVSMQKVVTLNTSSEVACLTFQLPYSTTGFFSEPNTLPTHRGSFQSRQHLKKRNKPLMRWKSFVFHKSVRWHFQVWWPSGLQFVSFWANVNNHKYAWIILLKMTFLDFPR